MNLLVISVIWSWVIMISFYMKRLNLQCVFFPVFLMSFNQFDLHEQYCQTHALTLIVSYF